ncbi:3-oxoacyl-ACP reductase [Actinorhabdospora filicis]|uniref:3-oxoacyl-ACP reductase n=1 Tax=Actinorhabdospora filicis TaxID=1785913 RepID=A0A9W6SMK6_9ACTN|nr:3-oxoacyl-ACP reductase family protein [Actinorhabdospora filicis]GLZ78579.1 3-oxoacyl-ACP reductase [Actinorhabdospora filicis]
MSLPLTGKVALVTGGSRGIGAAIALRLATDGADVALTYASSAEPANTVVKQITALGRRGLALSADAADPTQIDAAVAHTVTTLGRLDIVVNNAGHLPTATGLCDIDRTIAINVRAPLLTALAASPHLGHGGRIITIGSCLTGRVPAPGLTLYAMSKSAAHGLTRGLARDLGPRGITVNEILPGPIDTDMNPADGPTADTQRALTTLGAFGRPTDIAATVAFLASPEAGFLTGATIAVDGGTNV